MISLRISRFRSQNLYFYSMKTLKGFTFRKFDV
jgi:hypothetical protein